MAGFERVFAPEAETQKTHQTRVLGQMESIGCVRFKKFNCDFYFAPVRTRLARMALGGGFRSSFRTRSGNSENTPNMSFGSNGVDWARLFRKIHLNLIFRSSSHQSGQNGPRGRVPHNFSHPKLKLRKRTKHEFWVKWSRLGAFVSKNSTATFIWL